MDKSDSIKNIAVAMNKAQNEMSGASKAKDNPFFKSKYADLSEVVKAVKEPFYNNGLSYMQFPIEDNGRIGVETIVMHVSGEWISQKYTVQLDKQNAQSAGSALTYCRRYALQAVAGIPSEDDDGNSASQQKQELPWYNEPDYQADLQGITTAIKDGTPVEDIINQISQSFRISNKYKDLIRSI